MLDMSTLLILNFTLSITFMMMNHPLSMGLILLIQTIVISVITTSLSNSPWYSYILFLIMIGGMMILFMYMTSVASNELFKLNMPMLMMVMVTPTLILMMTTPITEINNKTQDTELLMKTTKIQESMMKFIQPNTSLIMIMLMTYLFIAMVATVKIASIKEGTLRQMN